MAETESSPPTPEAGEGVENEIQLDETDQEITDLVDFLSADEDALESESDCPVKLFLEAEEVSGDSNHSEIALERLSSEMEAAPESPDMKLYHSIMLQRTGEFAESLEGLESIVKAVPDNRVARYYYANALMHLGQWEKGLLELELSRGELTPLQNEFCSDISRLWIDQDLNGKHIVLVGNGRQSDQIQFSRFVDQLRKLRPRKIGIVSDSEMVEILRSLSEVNRVDSKPFEPFDYFIPVESLPLRLGAEPENLPNQPYLSCHDRKVDAMRARIKGGQPLLGICWRNHEPEGVDLAEVQYKDSVNSIELESLEWRLKELAMDYDLISFQQDLRADERQVLINCGCRILEPSEFEDLSNISEMLLCLDELLTVDSSIAHLAGALGVKAHVLLPFVPDWKWNVTDGVSSWYPHIQIHQKQSEDCWRSTVSEVLEQLKITKVMQKAS